MQTPSEGHSDNLPGDGSVEDDRQPPEESEQPGQSDRPRSSPARALAVRLLTDWRLRAVAVLAICLITVLSFPGGGSQTQVSSNDLADQILPPSPSAIAVTPSTLVESSPALGSASQQPEPLSTPPLDPNPLFVSPSLGNDDNDGTSPEAPWASLKVAMTRVQPGQTLYLMDGNYSETSASNFHYVLKTSGRPDAWIRLTAAPGHNPVLLAKVGTALEIQGNYVQVDGLTVTGEGFSQSNSFGVGLSVRQSHHVRFANNVISGMPLAGVSAIESSNIDVSNNEIFENAQWSTAQGSGISVWHSVDWDQPPAADGYHDRIIGNRIYRNENKVLSRWKTYDTITDGNGIIIDQNRDFNYTGRTLIANNVIFDNGGRAILVFESNRVDVMFNTTYHNGWTDGLEGGPVELAAGTANDVRFVNNAAWALPGAPAMAVSNSNQISTEGNVLVTSNPSGHAGDLDLILAVDPGLVNPSIDEQVADFRPEPTGVLVGRAAPARPSLAYDIDGTSRDPESADVGAYELPVE